MSAATSSILTLCAAVTNDVIRTKASFCHRSKLEASGLPATIARRGSFSMVVPVCWLRSLKKDRVSVDVLGQPRVFRHANTRAVSEKGANVFERVRVKL